MWSGGIFSKTAVVFAVALLQACGAFSWSDHHDKLKACTPNPEVSRRVTLTNNLSLVEFHGFENELVALIGPLNGITDSNKRLGLLAGNRAVQTFGFPIHANPLWQSESVLHPWPAGH